MKNLCLLLVILNLHFVSGQEIRGEITLFGNKNKEPVSKARIDFICGQDTVFTTFSGENGQYEYCEASCKEQYTMAISKPDFNTQRYAFKLRDTVSIPISYIIDFKLSEPMIDDICSVPYFDINRSKDIYNFNIERFKRLLDKHPGLCLKAVVNLYPGESEKLIAKRIKSLKELLISWDCDMRKITLSHEIHYMKLRSPEQRSYGCPEEPHIYFEVLSMEGDCTTNQ